MSVCAHYDKQGSRLFTTTEEGTIQVRTPGDYKVAETIEADCEVYALQATNGFLVSGGEGNVLKLYDGDSFDKLGSVELNGPVSELLVAGKRLFAATSSSIYCFSTQPLRQEAREDEMKGYKEEKQ